MSWVNVYTRATHRCQEWGLSSTLSKLCGIAHRINEAFEQCARNFSHSTALRGGGCHRSTKAARGEDLDIEEPVACWDCASFHFHATLTRMLGSTLIRNEIVHTSGRAPSETPVGFRPDDGSLSWRTVSFRWRYGPDPGGCASRASVGLRAPYTTPLSSPGTNAGRALHWPSPPCGRRSRQSAVTAGRVQTRAAQFIGLCSKSKWSRHLTKSPFLALRATAGSNAADKILSACSHAVS
jgi:hypothetical protein